MKFWTLRFMFERRWPASFFVALSLILILSYIVAKQINDTRQEVLILVERVRVLRIDLDEIKTHGSPITDRRLSVLEYKAGVK